MARKTKNSNLSIEERLEQALIPNWDEPYKVPDNWCWAKLKTVVSLENGYKSDEEKLIYLDAKTLRGVIEPQTRNSGVVVEKGQKVILVDGENSGEVFISPYRGYMGSTFRIINIARGVNEKYIRYFIEQNRDKLKKNKIGSAIPHLNKEMFFGLELPLPPVAEQQRIVARIEFFFAKLDEARENVQDVVAKLETRKAAILHKAFSGELTAKWRKENNVEKDSWKSTKFKDFCLLKRGFDLPATKRINGDYPLVSSSGIIDTHNIACVKGPGVVTGRSGTIGKVFYVEKDYWPLNTTLYSQELFGNDAKYVSYYLQTFDFKSFSSSTAVPTLNRNKFMDETVLVPTVDEQKEIVRILDGLMFKIHQTKIAAEAVAEQIDIMKKAILARAFRGELGTHNPIEDSAVELIKTILGEDNAQHIITKNASKRITIPIEIKMLLSNIYEEEIIKQLMKFDPDPVSIQVIMSLSSKKFELIEALRTLENKQLITKNESREYSLKR